MRTGITRKIIRAYLLLMLLFAMPVISFAAEDPAESLRAVNGIPLVIVYVNENADDIAETNAADPDNVYGKIQDMNTSKDHSVRGIGSIKIVLPETGEYANASVPADPITLKYIRGRGNYTWNEGKARKKPYKIKLSVAQDLFGMGAETEWALLANDFDKTLLRNRITSWIGLELGLSFTPQSVPVDVVMIGTDGDAETYRAYLGSYNLSELVDIGENRVNIQKLKKSDTGKDVITGGYLLAIYDSEQDKDLPASTFFRLDSGIEITNDNPEFESEDLKEGQRKQREYIRGYVQKIDDLIMKSAKITPEIHNQIDSLIDLESLANYWWVQEFSCNSDAFETGSTYLYKDRGDKLYMGPLWDFDVAWLHVDDAKIGYTLGFNSTEFKWTDTLREKDPLFAELLKERWNDPDSGMYKILCEITDRGGIMDRYMDELCDSWTANNELMNSLYGDGIVDYDTYAKGLRTWIVKRREWINNNLDSIGRVHFTITYADENGVTVHSETVRGSKPLSNAPQAPEKEGYVFTGWKEKETGADHEGYIPYNDVTFYPAYTQRDEVPMELGAPSISTRAVFKKKQVAVTLGTVDGAAGYRVEYRKAGTGSWKSVAAVGNTVVIGKMKKGGLYQIRAAAIDSNKKAGKYSEIKYCFIKGMNNVRFKARKSSIRATWKKSKGAGGYQILISGNKDLKDARIITVKGRNKKGYTIKGLEKGKRYYIAARPYRTKGGKRYIGIRSRKKSLKVR